MDSSYEDSDVELEGSFAQTGSVATISNPPSDPATIPLSRPFDGTVAKPTFYFCIKIYSFFFFKCTHMRNEYIFNFHK